MHTKDWLILLAGVYLAVNFACALALHLHAERQAHLRVRFLDVLMHFVLLTAFAVPILLVILAEALFGEAEPSKRSKLPPAAKISHASARAA